MSAVFNKKGFGQPLEIRKNSFNVFIYKKQFYDSINVIQKSNSFLYVIGSCFYKFKAYREGLNKILSDYLDNGFDNGRLIGSYFLLFDHEGSFRFYSDPAGVQNIYYHQETGIISSSFLACMAGAAYYAGKLKLNTKAVIEVLITGNLIGPETLVEGILRYESSICQDLPGIRRVSLSDKYGVNLNASGTFISQINNQLNALGEYFAALKPVVEEMGAMSGLTGGFDSRLLLLSLRKATRNYKVYSTYRSSMTKEFVCAKEMTNAIGCQLFSPVYRTFQEVTTRQFLSLLQHNCYFNDGLIRVHQLWTEEIKSKSYLAGLYGEEKIGFSGVGGEQYRNHTFLLNREYRFKQWFFYEFIFRHCRDPFLSDRDKDQWLQYIQKKIYTLLGLTHGGEYISRYDISRYYNEIYNPANRVVRNNIENQLYFFLSPFTDYHVSKVAYEAHEHLGRHHIFEKEMIRRLAPELAHINLDYGYSVGERIPLRYNAAGLLKKVFGLRLFSLYKSLRRSGRKLDDMCDLHSPITKYVDIVDRLELPISLNKIKNSDHLSPLIIETGFLIKEASDYVSCN